MQSWLVFNGSMKRKMKTEELTIDQLEEQASRYASLIVEIEKLVAEMKRQSVGSVWIFGMPTLRNAWRFGKSMRMHLERCREKLVDGNPYGPESQAERSKKAR